MVATVRVFFLITVDVVFLIYMYQRWVYRVDKNRLDSLAWEDTSDGTLAPETQVPENTKPSEVAAKPSEVAAAASTTDKAATVSASEIPKASAGKPHKRKVQ